ncbi:MAG: helix-turn-helix domain-containing protein [Owenweeksia sp.]|nr:helix-turn-helix domain-containing protein [Owenweeksia sp.]
MSITTNTFIDFGDTVGSIEAQQFKSCLDQPIGFTECCRKLNSYFLAKKEITPDLTCVQTALKLIENHQGYISMKELAQGSGVSGRQLRRLFSKVCGINPQRYAKIIQMRHVMGLIENKQEYRLTDLAYDSNFFDVSHFIRTFQGLVGKNPRDFLESENHFLQTYLARR